MDGSWRWRAVRRLAVALSLSLVLTVAAPAGQMAGLGPVSVHWSRLLSWFAVPPLWAHEPTPSTPSQRSGTAAGKSHYVDADATRAGAGAGRAPGKGAGQLPLYKPSTPKTPEAKTPSDGVFDPATSKRMATKSTATQDVYQNADGSYTREVHGSPVNYLAADGSYQPIDTSLVSGGDGRWHERANSPEVDFAPTATGTPLISVTVDDSHTIDLGLLGAAPVPAEVSGSTVMYPSVLPETNLVERTFSAGVKESIVLNSSAAPNSWVFPLELRGLTARPDGGGGVAFVDESGTARATMPHGSMQDSQIDPRSGDGAGSEAVEYSLTTVDGAPALRVTADATWLADPARVYPVTVDPPANFYTTTTDYAQTGNGQDHSGEELIKAGTYDSGAHIAASYLAFSGFASSFAGDKASKVSLHIFDVWAYTCTAEPFHVGRVTQSWSTSTVTGYPGPAYTSLIGTSNQDPGAACSNSSLNPEVGTWMTADLGPQTFIDWVSGAQPNYGLAVFASETDSSQWKQFAGYNSDHVPYLQVTYSPNVAPQVTGVYPPNNYNATTLTPELAASATDADAFPKALTYTFTIFDASNGSQLATSGAISSSDWVVPAGKLSWGKNYYWAVSTNDGYSSSAATVSYLNTPVPQPLVTSGLSQSGDQHGFDPSIGDYTTSATDAQVATVGPELSVQRDYNSQDLRTDGAFGAGWSSLFDAQATEMPAGAPQTVVVTYPDGSEVAFGKNADGSWAPAQGRFATFAAVSGGGYRLTDKNDTIYTFARSLGGGAYGISSVTDANGHVETFGYDSSGLSTVTSASGRKLYLTWATPTGAAWPHVASVATDPVVVGQPDTALTWTYSYDGDSLTKVCPPNSTACTTYGYTTGTQYPEATLDAGPRSYWRLTDAAGSATAADTVPAQQNSDPAQLHNVTLGVPGGLAGSTATAASFNGSSSYLTLPNGLAAGRIYQTLSLWFKTTTPGGVLFSYQKDPITNATTSANYTPALYVGSSGKLRAELWPEAQMSSSSVVTDGLWHHAVLAGGGDSAALYLDGQQVAATTGTIASPQAYGQNNDYIGVGFIGGSWPDEPHYQQSGTTAWPTYFTGSISDVAFYDRQLTGSEVSTVYGAGHRAASPLSKVTRPSGNTYAQVDYSTVTGLVNQVTDENGGVWKLAAPTVAGSSAGYVGSVLGTSPQGYWRLDDSGAAAVSTVDEPSGTYNAVTLGAAGVFRSGDDAAASFNGTSSYAQLPDNLLPASGAASVELWFKTTTRNGVLLSSSADPITNPTTAANYTPELYVGSSGKLLAKLWRAGQITSPNVVSDGAWHQVVLTSTGSGMTFYLDGAQIGTSTGAVGLSGQPYTYLGTGFIGGSWPDEPHASSTDNTAYPMYFNGSIDEFSFYTHALSAADVANHYGAAISATGVTPVQTVSVTDPGSKTISYQYDVLGGMRLVAETNALGQTTRYGYDSAGFEATVTDPNGVVTTTGHDVRGNTVSTTTCQDQSTNKCSTVYYTYYPDDTSTTFTSPDPRNDQLLTMRDARSASATDNTYLTSYAYDSAGNVTSVTTPPVPGAPNGRATTTLYTDGTSVAAADGGYAPAGLPRAQLTPGGALTAMTYYQNGDLASLTEPDGQVTSYTYDGLGRITGKSITYHAALDGSGTSTTLTSSYVYDGVGQVTSETDPPVTDRVTGAVHTSVVSTDYDDDGNVTSRTVTDRTGGDAPRTTSATYDEHGKVASQTDSAGATTTFSYDAYGNQTSVTDPAGNQTVYEFDADANLLTTRLEKYTGDPTNPSSPTDLVLSSYAYDPTGRVATVTDAMGYLTSYTYTDDGLTAAITRTDPTLKTSFVNESDTYDAAGNLIQKVSNNGATTEKYTVDAASRPTSSVLDPNGLNRTTTSAYTLDDAVASSTVSDANGSSTTDTSYDSAGNALTQTTYLASPATTPVARWRLDQTSGTQVPDSAGNAAGSATGVSWTNDPSRGQVATFGSDSSVVRSPAAVVDTTRAFTIAGWVKLSAKDQPRSVLVLPGVIGNSALKLSYQSGTDRWSADLAVRKSDSTVAWVSATSTAGAPQAGVWAHLAVTVDPAAGAVKLYVNGGPQGSATSSLPFDNQSNGLQLGNAAGMVPAGSLSDIQVYQAALTAAQVSAVYNGTAPAAGPGVVRSSSTLDQRGLPTKTIDPDGNATSYAYDEAGQLAVTTAPAVNTEVGGGTPVSTRPVTMTGYDTFGEQVESSDADGNTTTYAYDAAGRLKSTTLPDYTPPGSSDPITAVARQEYDKLGQVITKTDPLGYQTSYVYDQLGRTATATEPNGGVTHYAYDLNGELLSTTDPTGAQSQATYDWLGRTLTSTDLVRQPNSVAYTTTNEYSSPAGWLAKTTTPAGVSTSYTANAAGETTSVTDGAGNTTSYRLDYAGRTVATVLPDGTSNTVSYDPAGRALGTASLDASGKTLITTSSAYDLAGNQVSATNANGVTSTFAYDPTGVLVSQTQPVTATKSITTSFGYDAAGNRTRYTDGRGNRFLTTYNSWNLAESQIQPGTTAFTSPSDSTFTTAYDADGDPVSQTAPGGVVVSSEYNNVGDLTAQRGSGADAATADRSFGYDQAGRLTSVSAPGGTDTFTRDDRGLLLSASGPSGSSSFAYTADGSLSSRTDAAGTTSYHYDNDGRVDQVSDASTGVALTYSYDSLSQLSRIAYGQAGDTRQFGYDPLHRLTSDTVATSSGATIAKITYGYDNNSNVTSKTTSGYVGSAANTYSYDLADRLTSWTNGANTTQYEYDDSGNRTRVGDQTYTYDARDQLVSGGGSAYTYTARGTLASTVTGSTQVSSTFDAYGEQVTQGSQSYTYDGLGRVLSATGAGSFQFAYSGEDQTLASDGAAKYSYDPAGSLTGVAAGGVAVLALTDQHDDVVGELAGSGATALSGSEAFDPWGNVLASAGMVGNLGYQSGWTDPASSRVAMGSRWYAPGLGQFSSRDTVSVDPAGDASGANPFAYLGDNPLAGTDPSGHWGFKSLFHKVTSAVSTAYHAATSAVATAYHATTSAVSSAWNKVKSTVASVGKKILNKVTSVVRKVASKAKQVYHKAVEKVKHVVAKVRKAATAIRHAVEQVAKEQIAAAKKKVVDAYHKATREVNSVSHAAVQWAENHADLVGMVAGVVAGVIVGGICTAATAGAAVIGCGALSGFVGGAISGAVTHGLQVASGQAKGGWGGWLSSVGTGALLGAAGGALGGAIGGKVFGMVGEDLLKSSSVGIRVASNAWAGGVTGLLTGGVMGAADYGTSCVTGAQCSVGGAVHATSQGALFGAALGAGFGAIGGKFTKPGCANSFDEKTKVLLADGSAEPIKDVKLGDKVKATDPGTGKTAGQPVTALHLNQDTALTDLGIRTSSGATVTVHTTPHHPFYDLTHKAWVDAGNLNIGDRLYTATTTTGTVAAGTAVVTTVHSFTGLHPMYNLTVNDTHTYYVIAGTTPVLVHNCPASQPRGANGQFQHDPNAVPRVHTRDTEYPSGFRASTHAAMKKQWTNANGDWLDEQGNVIDPDDLTYDHIEPVVDHWNRAGYNTSRAERNNWYNDPSNLRPMSGSANSSAGGMLTQRYRQDVGSGYSS